MAQRISESAMGGRVENRAAERTWQEVAEEFNRREGTTYTLMRIQQIGQIAHRKIVAYLVEELLERRKRAS